MARCQGLQAIGQYDADVLAFGEQVKGGVYSQCISAHDHYIVSEIGGEEVPQRHDGS